MLLVRLSRLSFLIDLLDILERRIRIGETSRIEEHHEMR
jgi:hypothetical protein